MSIYRLVEKYNGECDRTHFEIQKRYEQNQFPFGKRYYWSFVYTGQDKAEALTEFTRITTSPSYTKVIAEKEARKL